MLTKDQERIILLLEKDLFVDWLRSKNSDAIVGFRRQKNCCPVATYLGEKGIPFPDVDNWQVWVKTAEGEDRGVEIPIVFRDLIVRVDLEVAPDDSTVTAGEVLAYIDKQAYGLLVK